MEIAKLTSKGQLTLPISIRRQLGLFTGDKVAFVEKDGELMLVRAERLIVSANSASSANIQNVVASMRIEGLNVSDESMQYMMDRLEGKISLEERISQIKRKYAR